MNLGLLYGGLDIRAGGLKRDTALLKGLTEAQTADFSTDVLLYTQGIVYIGWNLLVKLAQAGATEITPMMSSSSYSFMS